MAILKDGKIVAHKNAGKKLKSGFTVEKSPFNIGTSIWFIGEEHRLYEGKTVKQLPNGYWECSVQNKNIHASNEWQTAVVEELSLHINKD